MEDTLSPREIAELQSSALGKLADLRMSETSSKAERDSALIQAATSMFSTMGDVHGEVLKGRVEYAAARHKSRLDSVGTGYKAALGGKPVYKRTVDGQLLGGLRGQMRSIDTSGAMEPFTTQSMNELFWNHPMGDGAMYEALKEETGGGQALENFMWNLETTAQAGDTNAQDLRDRLVADIEGDKFYEEAMVKEALRAQDEYLEDLDSISGMGPKGIQGIMDALRTSLETGDPSGLESAIKRAATQRRTEGEGEGEGEAEPPPDETPSDRLVRFLDMIEDQSVPEHIRAKQAIFESPEFKEFMRQMKFKPGSENIALRSLHHIARAGIQKARVEGRATAKAIQKAITEGAPGVTPRSQDPVDGRAAAAAVSGSGAENVGPSVQDALDATTNVSRNTSALTREQQRQAAADAAAADAAAAEEERKRREAVTRSVLGDYDAGTPPSQSFPLPNYGQSSLPLEDEDEDEEKDPYAYTYPPQSGT
jgi:hypothetical protein